MNNLIYTLKIAGMASLLFLAIFFFIDIFLVYGSWKQMLIAASISIVSGSALYIISKRTNGFNSLTLKESA